MGKIYQWHISNVEVLWRISDIVLRKHKHDGYINTDLVAKPTYTHECLDFPSYHSYHYKKYPLESVLIMPSLIRDVTS